MRWSLKLLTFGLCEHLCAPRTSVPMKPPHREPPPTAQGAPRPQHPETWVPPKCPAHPWLPLPHGSHLQLLTPACRALQSPAGLRNPYQRCFEEAASRKIIPNHHFCPRMSHSAHGMWCPDPIMIFPLTQPPKTLPFPKLPGFDDFPVGFTP